ncbi:hypothetical protein SETIT_5G034300v2 [Setaria italica]|uniref:Uncharacterized protein n=1 Tax=Setaria italica TaxID=4555 RepID=A0A368R2Q4_SETIT|nr:hypothetical protein SETIT_5G034300v2 [Setaria italica]
MSWSLGANSRVARAPHPVCGEVLHIRLTLDFGCHLSCNKLECHARCMGRCFSFAWLRRSPSWLDHHTPLELPSPGVRRGALNWLASWESFGLVRPFTINHMSWFCLVSRYMVMKVFRIKFNTCPFVSLSCYVLGCLGAWCCS